MKTITYYHFAMLFCISCVAIGCGSSTSTDSVTSESGKEKIKIEAYSSYNEEKLDKTEQLTNEKNQYNELISEVFKSIGLPGSDIEVETVKKFGAFAVINKSSNRRFLLYSPVFFDSVFSLKQSKHPIKSICFHELAHLLYNHPLKNSSASRIHEKQADWYAGFQMYLAKGTLDDAILAVNHFAPEKQSSSHPGRADRVATIISGYLDAQKLMEKDTITSLVKEDLLAEISKSIPLEVYEALDSGQFLEDNLQLPTFAEQQVEIGSPTYLLFGERIYLDTDHTVKYVGTEEVIGKVILDKNTRKPVSLDFEGVLFDLKAGTIYSKNPNGSKTEVGHLITN
ncbi:hypothetical protein H9Y05_01185 [Crocinitomicaceae bacterium CZZ-1]|uniref:Peptidase M48 domain-containing protein n=1 Tax=Taishania pollutisoli TaxID=2766479 RepID=A0A8J6TYJ0_9FLAO|nr:hypothetical protein [Taishania pollutisoli]MBC9811078.1 hypothetical protein [Taishania pollutisoli]MBX2950234.1 hypothetical protein [Crocinitomicaceae bacterium]NGF76715.1 hypothetical protein [Fluviicola sp. SGL-29]